MRCEIICALQRKNKRGENSLEHIDCDGDLYDGLLGFMVA